MSAMLKVVEKEGMENKTKALDAALAQIERAFGKGSIMKLGDRGLVEVPVISTSSLSIDYALGVGGIPKGRVVEIFGPESSGKTTLALTIIAHAQKLGGAAVFIDAEHALDAAYAQKLGVDIANLHVSCAIRNCEYFELLVPEEPFRFPMKGKYPIDKNGIAHVPQKPGIGVELDWDAIDRACVEHREAYRRAAGPTGTGRLGDDGRGDDPDLPSPLVQAAGEWCSSGPAAEYRAVVQRHAEGPMEQARCTGR